MIQVFCLGPIEVERGPSAVAGFAFTKDRMEEPVFAASEEECLARMRDQYRGAVMYCEPSLGKLGRRLGYEPRALDDHLLTARAGLAFNLSMGHTVAATVKPPVVFELLQASAAFVAAEAWDRFDSDALVHVTAEGAMKGRWEASILGSAGQEFGIGIYLDPGTFARIHAVRDAAAGAALRAKLSTFSITFDQFPAFAVEAIEARTGVPFVPVPLRVEKGKMRPAEPKHLVVLAACLRAAASDDLVGTAAVANVQARVAITRSSA
jgi:hypothetical protein